MKGPQGHVTSHLIVNTSNGEGGEWGCFINMDPHSQCMSEVTSYRRSGSTEFVGPANSRSVVTPGCHADVLEDSKVLSTRWCRSMQAISRSELEMDADGFWKYMMDW